MEKRGYKTTSEYYKNAGIIWFILAIFISFVGSLQLQFGLFSSSEVIGYGKLTPIFLIIVIFGSILSFFLSMLYDELDKLPIDQIKPTIVGNISFYVHQLSLVFGLLTIMLGRNDGRIYGEMNFITDNLFMLVFTIAVVLTLVHVKTYGKVNGIFQLIIFTLAGMMATFFLGNFGFPNSYITIVPPTSGFQDAISQGFYTTGVLVFFVGMPLISIFYSVIKNYNQIDDEGINFSSFFIMIAVLVSISGGVGLGNSPYQNFWTWIGNYVYSVINLLFLGFMYYLHNLYYQTKKEHYITIPVFGIALSIFFLVNTILSLPIIYRYIQYTSIDVLILPNKVLYLLMPLYFLYTAYQKHQLKEPIHPYLSNTFLAIFIIIMLLFGLESILQSFAIYEMKDGNIVNNSWEVILSKTSFVHYVKIILDIVYLIIAFLLVPIAFKTKEFLTEKTA
ncbi:MAG: hypothetical protein NZ853_10045 [Leptospiraceae bacterium]|nr:hypothetical protein [Leptospiraceae bacterium]MDW7975003.1 hypothetical protein [Leptospiraceae bacterium]